jgi:hypothetical protein
MRKITGALGLLLVVGMGVPAMATVRAYVLIETEAGKTRAVQDSLGSMANCKALFAGLWPDEIVAHIECTGPADLSKVVTDDIGKKDGVKRATVWTITNGQ